MSLQYLLTPISVIYTTLHMYIANVYVVFMQFMTSLVKFLEMKRKAAVKAEIEVKTKWSDVLKSIHHDNEDQGKKMLSSGINYFIPDIQDIFTVSVFSQEECASLINAAESYGFGETEYPKAYRGNLRLITYDNSLAEVVWSRIQNVVPSIVTESGRKFKAVGLNSCWRLAKYFPGDQFGAHVDAYYEDHKTGHKSMFTVNIYMNGGFEGGNTTIFIGDNSKPGKAASNIASYDVVPEPGLCMIFRQPPAKSYLHKGQTVIAGEKYLFRSDVMYEPLD
jgi:hypothetical protein